MNSETKLFSSDDKAKSELATDEQKTKLKAMIRAFHKYNAMNVEEKVDLSALLKSASEPRSSKDFVLESKAEKSLEISILNLPTTKSIENASPVAISQPTEKVLNMNNATNEKPTFSSWIFGQGSRAWNLFVGFLIATSVWTVFERPPLANEIIELRVENELFKYCIESGRSQPTLVFKQCKHEFDEVRQAQADMQERTFEKAGH
jgi:hypothetical protein